MRSDIALGVVTFIMAVLGGVVSAHAPVKAWHKWLYASMFVMLGIIGLYFVIQQSNETAVATSRLSTSLDNLNNTAAETTRVQILNTELQKRLLLSTATITDLSKLGINVSSGGNSWAYLKFLFQREQTSVIALHGGNFPLADVSVRIRDGENTNLNAPPLASLSIGTLPVRGARVIGTIAVPDVDEKRYTASFMARNGNWDQLILLRRKGGKWYSASVIQQNPGQVRFAQLKKLPGPPTHPFIDKYFPGTISPSLWRTTFSGQFLYCLDCQ